MRNGLAGSRAVIESIVAQATSSLGSLALMIAAATSLSTALGCERYHLFTGHPLLARTMVPPSDSSKDSARAG